MSETRVVRHRAEYIEVSRLRFQIDRQAGLERAAEIGIAPRAVKRAEQRTGARTVQDRAILAHPVREDVAAPANPALPVFAEQQARKLRRRFLRQLEAGLLLEQAGDSARRNRCPASRGPPAPSSRGCGGSPARRRRPRNQSEPHERRSCDSRDTRRGSGTGPAIRQAAARPCHLSRWARHRDGSSGTRRRASS